jgi:Tol biopolymer transport system component
MTDVEGLLFQSDRDGNWEIYRADGCDAARLTDDPAADTAPQWCTAATGAVFQSDRDGNWEIFTMTADGDFETNLSKNGADDTAPTCSDGYIYFQSNRDGNWEIYRMNADGSGQTRLTDHPAADAQPAASSDGRVAFQSKRNGNWDLYMMNWDGSGLQRLTSSIWDEVSPCWSPDDERMAFQSNDHWKWQLAVMDLAAGTTTFITGYAGDAAGSPLWWYTSAAGSFDEWIFFQGLHLGDWDIYRVKPDGSVSQRTVYNPYACDMLDDQVAYP